jgi:hypothetical protein
VGDKSVLSELLSAAAATHTDMLPDSTGKSKHLP